MKINLLMNSLEAINQPCKLLDYANLMANYKLNVHPDYLLGSHCTWCGVSTTPDITKKTGTCKFRNTVNT